MFSDRKTFVLIVTFTIEILVVCGIQVPSHPTRYSDRYKVPYPTRLRQSNGYRSSVPKYKKPVVRVPSYRQEVDFSGSVTPLGDAIRIVDPPVFFQDQKKHYQKKPIVPYPETNPGQYSTIQRPLALPLYEDETSYRGPEYSPYPQNPQKYVAAHHAVSIQHPRPAPTYLGIPAPNSNSIRSQLAGLKEKQRLFFEDELDEHPARQQKQNKKKQKPSDSKKNTPATFGGYDIFNEEKEKFQRLKNTYRPAKTYSVVENSGQEPDSTEDTTFVPYKMLASVRHTKRVSHKPRESASDHRAKQHLRTKKTNTVYSEQGFDDSEYDHGDEARHGSHDKQHRHQRSIRWKRSPQKPKEHIRTQKTYTVYSEQGYEDLEYDHGDESRHADHDEKYRFPRDAGHFLGPGEIETVEQLPVALNLIGSDGEKLSGQALLKHIAQLIKNSSQYLPADPNESDPDLDAVLLQPQDLEDLFENSANNVHTQVPALRNDSSFSFHHLDVSQTPDYSAIQYAEKLNNFNESPYKSGASTDCEEPEPNFEQNTEKKKLGNLGGQLDCLKEKFFGSNPLSNPFFTDDIISNRNPHIKPAEFEPITTTPKPPSSLLYDDVMKTIKSSLVSEKTLALLRYPELPNTTETYPDKFQSFTHPSTVKPHLYQKENFPIFDVTKFFPRVYMIRPDGKIYSIKFKRKGSKGKKSSKRRKSQDIKRDGNSRPRSTDSAFGATVPQRVQNYNWKLGTALRPPTLQHRYKVL